MYTIYLYYIWYNIPRGTGAAPENQTCVKYRNTHIGEIQSLLIASHKVSSEFATK